MSEKNEITVVNQVQNLIDIVSNPDLSLEQCSDASFVDAYEILSYIAAQCADAIKSANGSMKTALCQAYLETGEGKVNVGKHCVAYIPGSTRETFDAKALKAENPELYKRYVKISAVSDSVRVTEIKEKKEEK